MTLNCTCIMKKTITYCALFIGAIMFGQQLEQQNNVVPYQTTKNSSPSTSYGGPLIYSNTEGGGNSCGDSSYMNILWDEEAAIAQHYTDLTGLSMEVADDFVVPGSSLVTICELQIQGTQSMPFTIANDPANKVYMEIWSNDNGLPGEILHQEFFMGVDVDHDGDANFSLYPNEPFELIGGGHYWMSVYLEAPASSGTWSWNGATDGNNNLAATRNSGGGNPVLCQEWADMFTCGVLNQAPDRAMKIFFQSDSCGDGNYANTQFAYGGAGYPARITSHHFTTVVPEFSAQVADDFVAPGSETVSICEVFIFGHADTPDVIGRFPENEVYLEIWSNENDLPGELLYQETFVGEDVDPDGDSSFFLYPTEPFVLNGGGHYWLSVYLVAPHDSSGIWQWRSAIDEQDNRTAWLNVGGGWPFCTDGWDYFINCEPFQWPYHDMMMDIEFETTTLGIEDEQALGFQFYPNPGSDMVHFEAMQEIANVTLFNLLGQEVKTVTIGDTRGQLDISNLQTGMYVMKVWFNDNQFGTYSLIKE